MTVINGFLITSPPYAGTPLCAPFFVIVVVVAVEVESRAEKERNSIPG